MNRLSVANTASATISRVIITMVCHAPVPTTVPANVVNASVSRAGQDLIVLAPTRPILAFHHVRPPFFSNCFTIYKIMFKCWIGGGEICSGKGDCVCGECQCIEENGSRYSGKYCEECPVSQMNALVIKSWMFKWIIYFLLDLPKQMPRICSVHPVSSIRIGPVVRRRMFKLFIRPSRSWCCQRYGF